ncbi:MAG TPA: DUF4215 domain-containing protein, partial [Myxococcota bacterium]|nr:DUF4215 domain-containing protein [Myxococcota bacterium]
MAATLAALVLGAATAGCPRQSGLEVTVDGNGITGVRRIELIVDVAGEVDTLRYPRSSNRNLDLPQTVGVRFRDGRSGTAGVEAHALNAMGAIIGTGTGTGNLVQGITTTLFIQLTPVAAALCGDLVVTAPETCDDGNVLAGDGCDACQLECGDGDLDPTEVCDDGNRTDGDACSMDCQTAFAHIETVAGGPAASPDGAPA